VFWEHGGYSFASLQKALLIWGLAGRDFQMLLQEFHLNTVEERVISGDT